MIYTGSYRNSMSYYGIGAWTGSLSLLFYISLAIIAESLSSVVSTAYKEDKRGHAYLFDDPSVSPSLPHPTHLGSLGEKGEPAVQRHSYQFELGDIPTSNIWVGPEAGTSGINWQSITSDSQGMHLVAGSSNQGIFISKKCL